MFSLTHSNKWYICLVFLRAQANEQGEEATVSRPFRGFLCQDFGRVKQVREPSQQARGGAFRSPRRAENSPSTHCEKPKIRIAYLTRLGRTRTVLKVSATL